MGFSFKKLKESISLEAKLDEQFWNLSAEKIDILLKSINKFDPTEGMGSPFCQELGKLPRKERIQKIYDSLEAIAVDSFKIDTERYKKPKIATTFPEAVLNNATSMLKSPLLYGPIAGAAVGGLIARGVPDFGMIGTIVACYIGVFSAFDGKMMLSGGARYNRATKTILLGKKDASVVDTHRITHELAHHLMQDHGHSKILREGFAEATGCKLMNALGKEKNDFIIKNWAEIALDARIKEGLDLLNEGPKRFYFSEGSKPSSKGLCLIKIKEAEIGDRVYSEIAKGNYQILLG